MIKRFTVEPNDYDVTGFIFEMKEDTLGIVTEYVDGDTSGALYVEGSHMYEESMKSMNALETEGKMYSCGCWFFVE